MTDVGGRVARVVLLNYYLMVLYPISFFIYTLRYNMLWYGTKFGLLLTSFYFVTPFALLAVYVAKRIIKTLGLGSKSFDDGNVFFVSPPSLVASILWDMCKDYGMFVGCFLLVRTDREGILHTHHDEVTVKTWWRDLLEKAGAQIPRQLGSWDGAKVDIKEFKTDIVVKLPDSYLGIGDLFLEYKKEFTTLAELEAILIEKHPGKKGVLLLDWIRPRKDMEVHQLDIVTVRTPDGVQPLSILYWGDCSGPSSHSCSAGYICDFETESIVAPAKWYSYAFVNMKAPRIGQKLPGLKDAVSTAIKAHELIDKKWLKACGWDCMITDNRGPVFFEGNLAGARFPRRVFLDWPNVFALPKVLLSHPA